MLYLRKDTTKNYIRYRVRDPRMFKEDSFITLDIGETGKHQLVRARVKSNNEFKTQSVIVEKKYDKELWEETKQILRKANEE